jgi:hypothetical protein
MADGSVLSSRRRGKQNQNWEATSVCPCPHAVAFLGPWRPWGPSASEQRWSIAWVRREVASATHIHTCTNSRPGISLNERLPCHLPSPSASLIFFLLPLPHRLHLRLTLSPSPLPSFFASVDLQNMSSVAPLARPLPASTVVLHCLPPSSRLPPPLLFLTTLISIKKPKP